MRSRWLWGVAAVLVAGVVVSGTTFDGSVPASVVDAHRSPFTVASFLGAFLAGLVSFSGYCSDVPWFGPDKGELWSERQMRRATDYVDRGKGDMSKLGRTLGVAAVIAALGIVFYGEDSFRNFGILDAARFGSQ